MSIHEATAYYGKSNKTIYTHCKRNDGLVPFLRIGYRWILLRPRPYPGSTYHTLLVEKLRSQSNVGPRVVADLYGTSIRSIFDMCRRGEASLPHVKIGNRFFVSSRRLLTQLESTTHANDDARLGNPTNRNGIVRGQDRFSFASRTRVCQRSRSVF